MPQGGTGFIPRTRIAIFSDVHANLRALEAVLADIAAAGLDARYVQGDLVGYAPWPNETLDRLQAEGIPVVMGNDDDGTGFGRDECGCAYVKERDKAEGDARPSAIEASELPAEFSAQLREARGYR